MYTFTNVEQTQQYGISIVAGEPDCDIDDDGLLFDVRSVALYSNPVGSLKSAAFRDISKIKSLKTMPIPQFDGDKMTWNAVSTKTPEAICEEIAHNLMGYQLCTVDVRDTPPEDTES